MSRRSSILSAAITIALGASLCATSPQAESQSLVPVPGAAKAHPSERVSYAKDRFIVEFQDQALAAYDGGVEGIAQPSRNDAGFIDRDDQSVDAYLSYLDAQQDAVVDRIEQLSNGKIQVLRRMRHAYNGIVIRADREELAKLREIRYIRKIHPVSIYAPDTDAGPQLIGADGIWDGSAHVGQTRGEGMVVGIIDSGINHDHPSFADIAEGDGYDHNNPLGSGNYLGYCNDVDASFCNDKLIGAYDFIYDLVQDEDGVIEDETPEDEDSHGSHTASTVAGNPISVDIGPLTRSISGVAPRANIIAYDVCYSEEVGNGGCAGDALVSAIDQAVADGVVSVINYSISGGVDPYGSAASQAFLNATKAGVLAVASAGNSGPGAGTLGHQEPWTLTVGASTHDRSFDEHFNVTAPMSVDPSLRDIDYVVSSGPEINMNLGASLSYSGNLGTDVDAGADNTNGCESFPTDAMDGAIGVISRGGCPFETKVANAVAAGAVGVVVRNNVEGPAFIMDVGAATAVPSIMVRMDDGDAVIAHIQDNVGNASGQIEALSVGAQQGDVMAAFSSRGPNTVLDVLKPDVTAPGVNILAAIRTENAVGGTPTPGLSEAGLLSGTSMSSPHTAGAATLLRSLHPSWSPMQVKSALMMSAKNTGVAQSDGTTLAQPFDMGNGRVQVAEAAVSPLIMDETGANFDLANPADGGNPSSLNLPSLMSSNCFTECTWTRTVTNGSSAIGSWDVSIDAPNELDMTVSPSSFTLAPGRSATLTFSADAMAYPLAQWGFGSVTFLETAQGDNVQSHFSMAVQALDTTADAPAWLTKQGQARVGLGENVNYSIRAASEGSSGSVTLTDTLPSSSEVIPSSISTNITRGSATGGVSLSPDGTTLEWTGELEPAEMTVAVGSTPNGYIDLTGYGSTTAVPCRSSICDEDPATYTIPEFKFNGAIHNRITISDNGFVIVGGGDPGFLGYINQQLPEPFGPNNVLAPFWADMDLDGPAADDTGGGTRLINVFNIGGQLVTVVQWEAVEKYQDDSQTYSFQIQFWPEAVYFAYGDMPAAVGTGTVGAENGRGTVGDSYYYDGNGTAPASGDVLAVTALPGLDMEIEYSLRPGNSRRGITNVVTLTDDARTISASQTTAVGYDSIFSDSF